MHPVLTAPVSAVPALFATVRVHPDPFRPVKTVSSGASRFDGTKRAEMRSDRRQQGRNSSDGCGEDRTSQTSLHRPATGRDGALNQPVLIGGRCSASAGHLHGPPPAGIT